MWGVAFIVNLLSTILFFFVLFCFVLFSRYHILCKQASAHPIERPPHKNQSRLIYTCHISNTAYHYRGLMMVLKL